MLNALSWKAIFTITVGFLVACGEATEPYHPLYATVSVSDLESNYSKDAIIVALHGVTGSDELTQLSNEIRAGTSLSELQGATQVVLEAEVTAGEDGSNIIFTPKGWEKSKWHALTVQAPSVGRIEGIPQGDSRFVARFIPGPYLTVRRFEVCGAYGAVWDNVLTVIFSEKITQPAAKEIIVRQAGQALDCTTVTEGKISPSWQWSLTCRDLQWSDPFEVTLAPSVAGTTLRDLGGNEGYTSVVQLPSGYADQEKWCYDYAQEMSAP